MQTLFAVAGNTDPTYSITLERGGVAIDLTTASLVELIIENDSTHAIVNAGHQSCSIYNATAGIIRYEPVSTDFATGGRYIGSAKITKPTGVETLYNQVLFIIRD